MSANLHLLSNRSFLYFIGFRTSMVLGFQIVGTIAHWQVYAITRDSIYIGYLALSEVLPAIAMSLLGGYWADTFNRRIIALIGTAFTILSTVVLLLAASADNLTNIWPLFIAVVIIGIGRGIIAPASSALLGEIVPHHYFGRAAVFNSIGWHIALITGPAFAGIMYEKYSAALCYRYAMALTLASGTFLFLLKAPKREKKPREKITVAIAKGFQFLLQNKIVLGAMSLDMFAVLFGGAIALLPAFSDQIYMRGASGLGYLRAAPALGAAIMGLMLVIFPIRRHAGRILLCAVGAFGLAIIAFGLNTHYYLAIAILAFSGLVDNISVVLRSTILQTHTPDAMRGRVAAVNSIFIASSNEIGAFESGFTAKYMGLVPAVVFGGSMTIVVVLVIALALPELRRLQFTDSQK
jgi:MFS family permease